MTEDAPTRPSLKVVSGSPTPDEVAVLTAVLAATGGDDVSDVPLPRGGWSDPARTLRRSLNPGPGGWRSALQP